MEYHASHQNGVVETLIKSVRQSLNATCKNQAFTEEQWRTFLSETNYIINGRPLYPSSNDIWENPPITPNDILISHHLPLPQPEPEERINPRHKWRLERIIVTYPGKDGLVRKARIKTQDGEYDRPIHKLCLLATKEELNAEFS